jgi:nucleotide-binding universal stress UspA family protein
MKLLVAVDGSDEALRAAEHTVALSAEGLSVTVHLVNAQPSLSADIARFVSHDSIAEFHQEQGQEALKRAQALLESSGLSFDSEVRIGTSATEIVKCADEQGCQGIVMGSSGLGGVMGALMGSTAHRVLHLAKLPVTLVR